MIHPPIHVTIGATKSDVVTMQKVLQAIAKLSKDPALAYTLAPNWADGIVGPGTAKAVNLAVRKRIGKPPIPPSTVKKYVLKITETALGIVKQLQAQAASQKPAPAPAPKSPEVRKEEVKALSKVQKNDEKVLAKTKVTSGIIPVTSDSYLKFYPGNPARKTAPSYGVYKKLPGAQPRRLAAVLVIENLKKLKMTGKISAGTAKEIRKLIPKPWNTFSITLNGKAIAGRSTEAVKNPPPPVSPHVPPEAPPDATAADYSTPATPKVVQKDVAEKQPPPKKVAPPSLPPDPKSATPIVKKDSKGRTVIQMPPVTITAKPPEAPPKTKVEVLQKLVAEIAKRTGEKILAFTQKPGWVDGILGRGTVMAINLTIRRRLGKKAINVAVAKQNLDALIASAKKILASLPPAVEVPAPKPSPSPVVVKTPVLPEVPENEAMLEKFFAQEMIAGIMGVANVPRRIPRRSLNSTSVFDLRYPGLGPLAFQKDPYPTTVIPKDVQIMAGFDDMDDVDEELAEMQASGFRKGWW